MVAAGSLVQQHFALDKPAKPVHGSTFSGELILRVTGVFKRLNFLVICRPNNQTLPYDFNHVVKATKLSCEVTQNERALLAFLLAKINKLDPDIIVVSITMVMCYYGYSIIKGSWYQFIGSQCINTSNGNL